jgi:hypothetical protein
MRVNVTYDETDVAIALEKIIKDSNSKEFIKLITPMLCQSSQATNHFFKLMLGNKLPDVIPVGTLCKTHINHLGYGSNKEAIRDKYGDQDGNVIVKVAEFKGYHDYSNYMIYYTNVDDKGNDKQDYAHVQADALEIIEEI